MSRNRTPVSAARIIYPCFLPCSNGGIRTLRRLICPEIPFLPRADTEEREGMPPWVRSTEYRVILSDGSTTLAPAVIRDMHLLDQSRALVCVLSFPPPNQLYICTIMCVMFSLSGSWEQRMAMDFSFFFFPFCSGIFSAGCGGSAQASARIRTHVFARRNVKCQGCACWLGIGI